MLNKQSKLKPGDEIVLFNSLERLNPKSTYKPYLDMLQNRTMTPLISHKDMPMSDLPTVMRPLWQVERRRAEESFTSVRSFYGFIKFFLPQAVRRGLRALDRNAIQLLNPCF
ncbi:hypothetical protein L596_010675 [Steinernema carpocapsae]|uniref:Uncharacterized protein n=1 Tax=Steinernema carpocapsae TaxID=34508 RepID=A0A4U5PJ17_STECR|nr:hypothetical protein L596_010675 [Steinernema carpocapsae]